MNTSTPAGMDVTELHGEDAAEAISEFSGLELAPLPLSEWEQCLQRAGFDPRSPRSVNRDDADHAARLMERVGRACS